MNPCRLDVLHQATDHHLTALITEGIHIHLGGVLQVLIDQHRLVGVHLHRFAHVAIEFIGAEDHLHGTASQHVAGPHHNRVADAFSNGAGLIFTAGNAIGRLTNLQLAQHGLELFAVFRQIDRLGRGAPDAATGGLTDRRLKPVQQRQRQLQRGLAAELNNHPIGALGFDHVEHVFEGQRFEVEAIAGVVIGGHRLRVAVHHHRGQPFVLKGKGGVAAAVVELNALADPVGTAAQDHHLAPRFRRHLTLRGQDLELAGGIEPFHRPLVAGVVVRRGGSEFSGAGVDRFEHRIDAQPLPVGPHSQFVAACAPGDLPVAVAQLLELEQRIGA